VYNIEVEGDHCYRVGEQGLLVHNMSQQVCPDVKYQYVLRPRAGTFAKPARTCGFAVDTVMFVFDPSTFPTGIIIQHVVLSEAVYTGSISASSLRRAKTFADYYEAWSVDVGDINPTVSGYNDSFGFAQSWDNPPIDLGSDTKSLIPAENIGTIIFIQGDKNPATYGFTKGTANGPWGHLYYSLTAPGVWTAYKGTTFSRILQSSWDCISVPNVPTDVSGSNINIKGTR
jgi:hypothetical protein